MKKWIIIFIIIIAVIIVGGIGWLAFGLDEEANADETFDDNISQDKAKKEKDDIKLEDTKIYSVGPDPIISNINTQGEDKQKIIRVKVHLRLADEEIYTFFSESDASPQIIDTIITILRFKTTEDIMKPEAKEIIKEEIINAINKRFNTDKVIDLYFEEFIVQ